MSFSASLPKAALDQLKGFITLCKAKPEVFNNSPFSVFRRYTIPRLFTTQNWLSSPST